MTVYSPCESSKLETCCAFHRVWPIGLQSSPQERDQLWSGNVCMRKSRRMAAGSEFVGWASHFQTPRQGVHELRSRDPLGKSLANGLQEVLFWSPCESGAERDVTRIFWRFLTFEFFCLLPLQKQRQSPKEIEWSHNHDHLTSKKNTVSPRCSQQLIGATHWPSRFWPAPGNMVTYNTCISACEKAGEWEAALGLFQEILEHLQAHLAGKGWFMVSYEWLMVIYDFMVILFYSCVKKNIVSFLQLESQSYSGCKVGSYCGKLLECLNSQSFPVAITILGLESSQWEFQDPKMEVLYHIRPYFGGIFPYIGLT